MTLFYSDLVVQTQYSSDARLVLLQSDTEEASERLPAESFSLIVTSPPYNIGKQYENQVDLPAYLEWQTRIIAALTRVLHPRGSVCWQVGNYVKDAILSQVY